MEAGPSPDQVTQGQREAVDAVRRVMANLPPVSGENPLELPVDGEEQVPSITVKDLIGGTGCANTLRGEMGGSQPLIVCHISIKF